MQIFVSISLPGEMDSQLPGDPQRDFEPNCKENHCRLVNRHFHFSDRKHFLLDRSSEATYIVSVHNTLTLNSGSWP